MQAFCPKCDKEVKGSEEILLQQGTCTECDGGQLYISRPYQHNKFSDMVAVNFVPGSQLAVPLEPSLHITNLETFDEATEKISPKQHALEMPEITNVRPLEAPQTAEQTGVRNLEDIQAEHKNSISPQQDNDAVTAVIDLKKLPKEGTPVIHPEGNQREQPSGPPPSTIEATNKSPRVTKQLHMGIIAAILGLVVGLFIFKMANTEDKSATTQSAKAPEVNAEQTKQAAPSKFLEHGIAAYEAKDFPRAIKLFEQALNDTEQASDAHRNLGITFARMNQYSKAVEHYRAYLQLAPNAADAESVKNILIDYDQTKANR